MKILRIVNNWAQEEAAERCNTTQKIYWSLEIGKGYPKRKSQKSIANAYRVKVKDIFYV